MTLEQSLNVNRSNDPKNISDVCAESFLKCEKQSVVVIYEVRDKQGLKTNIIYKLKYAYLHCLYFCRNV